jgi:hypothetical protein
VLIFRLKEREKLLENELKAAVGVNWAERLEVKSSESGALISRSSPSRKGSLAVATTGDAPATVMSSAPSGPSNAETIAQLEKIRLLIIGMEERQSSREEHLSEIIAQAEKEGRRFQEASRVLAASSGN